MNKNIILTARADGDYELLGSGEGEKIERYGKYVLRRPDPCALWVKTGKAEIWQKADATFIRQGEKTEWRKKRDLPESWPIELDGLKLIIKLTTFKHTGVFPEQKSNWDWLRGQIKKTDKKVKVLNLFAYTGAATVALAEAGAEVVHVDASKKAIEWARENAALSGMSDKPIRWILEDTLLFLKREVKRGNKYDGIVMDPPAFGRGPKGELWKIEENFLKLMELCRVVLSDEPIFFLINGYTAGYSPIAYARNLEFLKKYGGRIEAGELTIEESGNGRLLPEGIFARWSK